MFFNSTFDTHICNARGLNVHHFNTNKLVLLDPCDFHYQEITRLAILHNTVVELISVRYYKQFKSLNLSNITGVTAYSAIGAMYSKTMIDIVIGSYVLDNHLLYN